MEKLTLQQYLKQNGDPYLTLEIQAGASKKEVKSAYKEMARKYHPDKNKDPNAQTIFLKVKQAYDFLNDKARLEEYKRYLVSQKTREDELMKTSFEARQFAFDLKRREEEAEKEKQKNEEIKRMKRQEEMERQQKELDAMEYERKKREEDKLKFELEHKDSYRKLNSVKVKWDSGSTYNRQLFELLFKIYGPIKEIVIHPKKPKAQIEFHTTEGANNAVESNKSSNDLKVRFFMKEEKRNQLQTFLKQSKEKIQRTTDGDVFTLSSDTLRRISFFYNKDSKVFVDDQTDLLRHEEERKKIIQRIYEEELNK